jgi:hypothetical protein
MGMATSEIVINYNITYSMIYGRGNHCSDLTTTSKLMMVSRSQQAIKVLVLLMHWIVAKFDEEVFMLMWCLMWAFCYLSYIPVKSTCFIA